MAEVDHKQRGFEQVYSNLENTRTIAHITIDDDANTAKENALRIGRSEEEVYFTDGSRNSRGLTGAAWVRGNLRVERQLRGMGRRQEAYDAELMAILMAIQDADKRQRLRGQRIWILSDSQAAIRRTTEVGLGPGQTIVQAIHQTERSLAERGIEIHYNWVPGHVGIPGNERADAAAREAADQSADIRRPTTLSHLHRKGKEWATEIRKRFIDTKAGSARYRGSGRKMNTTLQKARKSAASVYWQFACGHALTGDYLRNTIRKDISDACWFCGDENQQMNRTHLFERCAAFKEEIKQLRKDVQGALKEKALAEGRKRWRMRVPVRELFAQECLTGAVLDFLKATKIGRTGRPPEAMEASG
jgi:ribonuclease HI